MSPNTRTAEGRTYLELLRSGGHGAVAATRGAVPIVFPVAFELIGDRLRFEVASPEDPDPQLDGTVVAFDTAHVDGTSGLQWHVHVVGVAMSVGPHGRGGSERFALSTEMISGWIGED